jgi:acetolactate synthase I/II/III large subunit
VYVFEGISSELRDVGVTTLFGLLGDANLFLVDHFVRELGGRYVSAVHESSAVMMAQGYAMRSGRLGVATVTHGPGLTNTTTALVEASRSNSPVLIVVGNTTSDYSQSLQAVDQSAVIAATGAYHVDVGEPARIRAGARHAIDVCTRESRPVVLSFTTVLQWEQISESPGQPFVAADSVSGEAASPLIDEASLDAAAGIIASARRPLVIAGRGAAGARASVLELTKQIGAPIATTLRGRYLFNAVDGCVGVSGTLSTPAGSEVIADSDCIIAIGAGLNGFTTYNNALYKGKPIVHVDNVASRVGRYCPATVGLIGDAAEVCDHLAAWLADAMPGPSRFRAEVLARLDDTSFRWAPANVNRFDLANVFSAIDGALPARRTIAFDGGRFMGEAFKYLTAPDYHSQIFASAFGAVGMGAGAAIGAGCAAPDDVTVLVTGDGGLMMNGLAEIHSAVRCGVRLVVVVANDGSYGAEYDQFTARGMDPGLSLFTWPRFADVAEQVGFRGFTIESLADLEDVLPALARADAPMLLDVRVNPADVPSLGH